MTTPEDLAAANTAARTRRGDNQKRNSALPVICELTGLTGSLRGHPVIVAGAGPSIVPGILAIKKLKKPVAIVAVDRSFPILQENNLTPGVVILLDDQDKTQEYFKGRDLSRSLLIANTTANHGAASMFERRVFYRVPREMGNGPEPYANEQELWPRTSKMMATIGYVGGEALMVAHLLGGRPLILMGFDLNGAPGMVELELFLRTYWLPIARRSDPGLEVWNASPGSAWTEGVRTVAPADLPGLLAEPIPAPSGPHP